MPRRSRMYLSGCIYQITQKIIPPSLFSVTFSLLKNQRFLAFFCLLNLCYGETQAGFQNLTSSKGIDEEIYGLNSPQSGIQLLENCQTIFLKNFLLAENFYSIEFLQRVFGTDSIVWFHSDIASIKNIKITKFNFIPYENVMSLTVVNQWDSSKEASLQILILDSRKMKLPFEEVDKVFRGSWRRIQSDRAVMIMHAPPAPITDPHGQETMMYELDQGGLHRSLKIQFDSEGNLFYLFFSEQGV